MSKKIKVLTLGDHPLSPSGVGTQSRYVFTALLDSGKYEIISLGGAIKHHDYTIKTVEPYGADWKIIPVDGYGTQEMIRSIIRNEKPDILWMMTDPRFYDWLWAIENEIRALCPIIYYHVWDNYPYPMFNKKFYESNDHIATISKVTDDIVRNVAPSVPCTYLPHAVDGTIFTPVTPEQKKEIREQILNEKDRDRFIVFWNNRNARRKQSGSLLWWWSEWIKERGFEEKAQLIMHTDPYDVHGQDLMHIAQHLELKGGSIAFSTRKMDTKDLCRLYQMADVTINIADAEGFGLATLESLSCGTPIIATVTGGLQEQVIGPDTTFGIPLFPASKAVIGSQSVPYIYEDRLNADHVKSALSNMYDMGAEERQKMGSLGRIHVLENYNFNNFGKQWVDLMDKVYETNGSWETRKNYNGITFKEVA